jgi:hypothetical protein
MTESATNLAAMPALREAAPLARAVTQPMTPMEMLSQAVNNGAGIEVLEKLMALQERWSAGQARKAFDEAIAAAKAEIPVIVKDRTVGFESRKAGASSTNYKHESLGEIARTIDPILAKHGLSYRWRSAQGDGGIAVTCVLSHKDGHFEETMLKAGADNSGNKNSLQAIASTTTYLSRYTLKLALGLATGEGDDDGKAADGPVAISDTQLEELITLADAAKANKGLFCKHFGIVGIAQLPAAKFAEAKALLEAKLRKAEKEAKAQKTEATDESH